MKKIRRVRTFAESPIFTLLLQRLVSFSLVFGTFHLDLLQRVHCVSSMRYEATTPYSVHQGGDLCDTLDCMTA